MKKILLGVSGGIAAYKIPELVRLFLKENCLVKTILTENALRFCAKDAVAALSGGSVYSGLFEPVFLDEGHTELAAWPDVIVVAPATANTIAKLAMGIADNLLTATCLASPRPRLIVPSMNTEMYNADALQKNLGALTDRGDSVLPPDVGDLACKTYGVGRMPDLTVIVEAAHRTAGPSRLRGRRVLISAGASVEPIDDVRVMTNRSSGKMGTALAKIAYRMGADVTLVLGKSEVCPLPPVDIRRADTIESFQKLYADLAPSSDFFLAAAAIGDFVPAGRRRGKIPRSSGKYSLELVSSPDLLAGIARRKSKIQKTIGFSLQTRLDPAAARAKLRQKHLDAIFLNQTSAMESDQNAGIALSGAGGRRAFERMPKAELAGKLWEWIAQLD